MLEFEPAAHGVSSQRVARDATAGAEGGGGLTNAGAIQTRRCAMQWGSTLEGRAAGIARVTPSDDRSPADLGPLRVARSDPETTAQRILHRLLTAGQGQRIERDRA